MDDLNYDEKLRRSSQPEVKLPLPPGGNTELLNDLLGRAVEWPEHVTRNPAIGVIRAENLGPLHPEQPRGPYRVAFGAKGEAAGWQLAVKRSVRSEDAATVVLEVEVLRVIPEHNNMTLVLLKDAHLARVERPRLDGRIEWIDTYGPGFPVVWLPDGIVSRP